MSNPSRTTFTATPGRRTWRNHTTARTAPLVISQALDAVEHTAPGNHVNLVSHGEHGHPERYRYDALDGAFEDAVTYEYVQRCGCGGHVTRVHVGEPV